MSAHGRHLLRSAAIALAVCAAALALATSGASAYLTAGGGGSASASVTTLPAPAISNATAGAGSVALSWSSVAAPGDGTVTYYVRRDGGAASAACPSAASPTTVTSCTDTGVATGGHSYTVTAVWRSWTHASAPASATVASGAATQLVFTAQPGGSSTGGTAFPNQPVVTARDSGGNTVAGYGGTVTLSILRGGASGAALSGCTGTLRGGVTTFAGCEIDKSGTSYVLQASDGSLSASSSSFNVSVGAAAQLLFTTQPGGAATGGSAFPSQPVVIAADAGGNAVTSFSSTVTLSIVSGTGTAGATLTNCGSSRRSGVTTFDSCEIDKAGSGYQLHASAQSGALTGDSAAFAVSVGSVSQLAFTAQPGGGATGGLAFPAQPVVTAQDAGGNTVTSYARTIALSISGFGHDGTLSNCAATLSGGVTSFSGCAIDVADTGYQLRASDGSRSTTSSQFTVSTGPAAQLDFTTSPTTWTAGSASGTQPVVRAEDAGGNAVTSYAGTVALSIGSGPAGATLSGCTSSRRSGVTTFSACKLDKAGSYVLLASDGTISGDGSALTVNPGTATQLLFTTQPVDALVGTSFPTAPVVTAYDAFGNVATGYSSTVTLSIRTNPSGGSISNCSASQSNGVTTFRSCRISRSGTGYVLRASDSARTPLTVDSAAFNVR